MAVFSLVTFPWSRRNLGGAAIKRLDNDAGFVLNVEGSKVIALKLPTTVAKEIAGQAGMLARIKAKLDRHTSETEQEWLIVTKMQNTPALDDDDFGTAIAQALTNASGTTVTLSNLVISGRAAKTRMENQEIGPTVSHLEPEVAT